MGADYTPTFKPPAYQDDLVLNQVNPTSGLEYVLLPPTLNVRIVSISCNVVWTVQPSPIECRMNVDGAIQNFQQANPVSARVYIPQILSFLAPGAMSMADSTVFDPSTNRPFLLEGRSIRIAFETTGGTVQNLEARIKYALY